MVGGRRGFPRGVTSSDLGAAALAKENANTEEELIEALTHLAFYAGWPQAMAAMAVAKKVFTD